MRVIVVSATHLRKGRSNPALSFSLHRVPQDADPFYFHFHHVAGGELPGAARRARIDKVARLERYPSADAADDGRAIEDQVGSELLLHDFAIEAGLEEQIGVIEARDDNRAERSEGIAALGAPPLQVLAGAMLPVSFADVVAAGDAED